ncbi:replication endonuclease [Rouxiella badensis]|uniref:replication endonuclease n=1 Tax=Rouxiella badensis TaxID=1646377 RepID=UPI001CE3F0EF|nr:replication endonuclease [Rouxiella badensis]
MMNDNRGRKAPTPPPPFREKKPADTQWAYAWNSPREAVRPAEYPTYAEKVAADQALYAHVAEIARAYEKLDQQPDFIQRVVMGTITSLEQTNGVKRANMYLTKNFVERIFPRLNLVNSKYRIEETRPDNVIFQWAFNHLPDLSTEKIDALAEDIAQFVAMELSKVSEEATAQNLSDFKTAAAMFSRVRGIAKDMRQDLPTKRKKKLSLEDMTPVIARLYSPDWWKKRLRRYAAIWREHLYIAFGQVSKKTSAYASRKAILEWREQKRRTREFLKSMELEDDEGNRISLIDKYDASVSNPAIRRCELMTRIRGFENICEELGYAGEFYTITAPSRYHATNVHGHRNPKWDGTSPSGTQKYLCKIWAQIRAKLAREGVSIFGIRVAEPHQDGTPHWHMLMFMKPKDVEFVRDVISAYAMDEDSYELRNERARKARFHVETIDPDKGSATGYIAKYISKNIDGFALDDETDDESGKPLREMAASVSAWAARWRIRQFQFIGGAPVTVYRELRRLDNHDVAIGLSVEFAAAHDAADVGDWAGYTNAQGGPFAKRAALAVKNWYESGEELSAFGEEVVRIRGVYDTQVGSHCPIITRLVEWKIVPKRAVDLAVDLSGANATPWSSVNNCTGPGIGPQDGRIENDAPPLNLDKLTPKERRKLVRRVRDAASQEKERKRSRALGSVIDPGIKPEVIEKMREASRIAYGYELSLGEIRVLLNGQVLRADEECFRGRGDGELYAVKTQPKPLEAFQKLREEFGPKHESPQQEILRKHLYKTAKKR